MQDKSYSLTKLDISFGFQLRFSLLISFLCCLGVDFHWYRLDDNKLWSNKPGATAASNKDGDGKLISDPRKAAMGVIDYKFVSFMKIFTNIIE